MTESGSRSLEHRDDGVVPIGGNGRAVADSAAPEELTPRLEVVLAPVAGHTEEHELRFDASKAMKAAKRPPQSGLRKLVFDLTRGRINPGPSAAEQEERVLLARARRSVQGAMQMVAVVNQKGGVGKTTTTTGVGYCLAQVRPDRVIAADVNPDSGSLSLKVERETTLSGADLAEAADEMRTLTEVRSFTSAFQGGRLEVLASPLDPERAEGMGPAQYERVLGVIRRFYSICLLDCGTGEFANRYWLGQCDQAVVVTAPAEDCAEVAIATLRSLIRLRGVKWVHRNVVVVVNRWGENPDMDLAGMEAQFAPHVRQVLHVSRDPHLARGGRFEWELLAPRTRQEYLRVAAAVGDGLLAAQMEATGGVK